MAGFVKPDYELLREDPKVRDALQAAYCQLDYCLALPAEHFALYRKLWNEAAAVISKYTGIVYDDG